ncbi:MAG: hypothetical protein KKH52_01345 [Nanoarchaeota archaeon]|nr:hypothetical protein [Nanoarchaeota archaeon]MBU1622018.1 hypothetical protein [Nanoarchaeota archaeon]MBU1974021.1 hypothetical protein [Nanoarchaeota archaeon]
MLLRNRRAVKDLANLLEIECSEAKQKLKDNTMRVHEGKFLCKDTESPHYLESLNLYAACDVLDIKKREDALSSLVQICGQDEESINLTLNTLSLHPLNPEAKTALEKVYTIGAEVDNGIKIVETVEEYLVEQSSPVIVVPNISVIDSNDDGQKTPPPGDFLLTSDEIDIIEEGSGEHLAVSEALEQNGNRNAFKPDEFEVIINNGQSVEKSDKLEGTTASYFAVTRRELVNPETYDSVDITPKTIPSPHPVEMMAEENSSEMVDALCEDLGEKSVVGDLIKQLKVQKSITAEESLRAEQESLRAEQASGYHKAVVGKLGITQNQLDLSKEAESFIDEAYRQVTERLDSFMKDYDHMLAEKKVLTEENKNYWSRMNSLRRVVEAQKKQITKLKTDKSGLVKWLYGAREMVVRVKELHEIIASNFNQEKAVLRAENENAQSRLDHVVHRYENLAEINNKLDQQIVNSADKIEKLETRLAQRAPPHFKKVLAGAAAAIILASGYVGSRINQTDLSVTHSTPILITDLSSENYLEPAADAGYIAGVHQTPEVVEYQGETVALDQERQIEPEDFIEVQPERTVYELFVEALDTENHETARRILEHYVSGLVVPIETNCLDEATRFIASGLGGDPLSEGYIIATDFIYQRLEVDGACSDVSGSSFSGPGNLQLNLQ